MRRLCLSERRVMDEATRRAFRSLRSTFTMMVFLIFTMASCITGCIILLFYHIGALPMALFTPLILPLVTLGSCMLIGTMLAAFVSKLVLAPLRRLIEANDEIKKGNYKVRVDENVSVGEFNKLLHSFNRMAGELEGTEMFRNDFINNFSHEFKTPIVSIRGFARQIQKDNDCQFLTDEQRKEYTDIIVDESDRLARLSSNILLLTKFENQQIVTDKTNFYLDEQIRRDVLILEKEWSSKNIEPVLELEEIKYTFNEEMLSQVWLNLIGNAVKFSPEGGEIHIRCRKKEQKIIVDITDSGEGMDEATMHRIFDKFYQNDTSHKSEGNGLGLSIVKRIVELAHGEITVKSELGKGSTFRVSLPVESDFEI